MTTTAGFASLQAPAPEDSMEMSSPAQQAYDDDIDIDFEDPVGGVELTEDERMVEDSEQQRPATATDDMMEDDAPEVHVPEQEMQDDFDAAAYEQADPDDELIDYGDDEYQDMTNFHEQNQDVYEQQAPEINIEDREPSEAGYELADETAARESEESAPEPVAAVAEETVTESVHPSVDLAAVPVAVEDSETAVAESPAGGENTQTEPENATAASEEGDVAPQTADGQGEPESTTQHAEETFLEQHNETQEEESTVAQVPAPLNTSLEVATDAPGTPTDTGLHPMIVRYGDWEWPLFKSRKQPTGLLKDDNLASVALADLLNNCRYRLAMKAGEDISEDQEFVLRFDGTGLTIVENTPSAFNTSLDEILEVYKQLHINDGAQTIPPFWLHLSLQPKFSSYLTMLKQAAAGGQGISSFIDVSAGEPAEQFGEYGEEAEDADNDPTMLGNAYTEDYQDQAEYQGHEATADPELTETDYREYDTSYEATEGDHEGDHEAEDGDDQYDDAAYANYDENDEGFDVSAPAGGTEPAEPTEHLDESHYHEEPAAAADKSHQDDEKDDTDLAHSSVQPSHASSTGKVDGTMREEIEERTIDSAASSTTLRPDQANDVTEHGLDDTDDFSTFLAEPDAEATVDETHVGDDVDGNVDATLNEVRVGDDADGALSNGEAANIDANDIVNVSVHKDNTVADDSSAHEDDAKALNMSGAQVDDQAQQLGEHLQDDFSVGDAEVSADKAALSNGDQHDPEAQSEAERQNGEAPQDGVSHLATEGQEAGREDVTTIQPSAADEDYIDFDNEDDIDFDDDTYEQHEARKASEANSPESKSPSGKRPLDATDGLDLTEQPDLKKVRSS